jgi:hypothetical protein
MNNLKEIVRAVEQERKRHAEIVQALEARIATAADAHQVRLGGLYNDILAAMPVGPGERLGIEAIAARLIEALGPMTAVEIATALVAIHFPTKATDIPQLVRTRLGGDKQRFKRVGDKWALKGKTS